MAHGKPRATVRQRTTPAPCPPHCRRLARVCDHLRRLSEGAVAAERVVGAAAVVDDAPWRELTGQSVVASVPKSAYTFSPPLNEERMLEFYNREGFVVVSGLIPDTVSSAAADAVWRAIESWSEGVPERFGTQPLQRSLPSTWLPIAGQVATPQIENSAVSALWGAEYLRVGELLADGYVIEPHTPGRDFAPMLAPRSVMSISKFPELAGAKWATPGPHLDHCIKDDGFETFPRPVRMSTMTYLSSSSSGGGGGGGGAAAAVHSGCTIVWPRSARKMERLAASDPSRFRLMWDLGAAMTEAGVGCEGSEAPLEIQHEVGDVLFYEIFTAHAGSMNTSAVPRLAINMKWGSGKRVSERASQT